MRFAVWCYHRRFVVDICYMERHREKEETVRQHKQPTRLEKATMICNEECEYYNKASGSCCRTIPLSAVSYGAECNFDEGGKYHEAQKTTNRKMITKELSARTEYYLNPLNDPRIYWAREVTVNYGTEQQKRVDYMLFKPVTNSVSGVEKGDFTCFEVKSSVDDFRSKNGHNMIGDYNYYVMPEDVYEQVKSEIHHKIGVYVPDEYNGIRCIKKAKRQDREYSMPLLLLMMFRSANRDRIKAEK